MKKALLLLMTPGMSLEKWKAVGQLTRELDFYISLTKSAHLKLIIFSYGRNDKTFVAKYPEIEVLTMPAWVPCKLPFRVQNLIYESIAPFYYRKFLQRVVCSKTNQFSAARFGLILKFLYGIPLIIRMGYYYSHFQSVGRGRQLKEKLYFSLCNNIIVTSHDAGNYIKTNFRLGEGKVLSMCNFINLELFRPQKVDKDYDVIYIGRLEQRKNIKLLIEVAINASLKLLIIGQGALSSYVSDCALVNSNIIWIPSIPNYELPLYYSKSKVFLILSDFEGNPKSLLEAMACGIPCIGTNVPGITECLNNGVNGLITQKNVKDIQQSLRLLNTDALLATNLAGNAVNWVNNECDININISKEIRLINSLIYS